jgi:hypothetical protein
MTGRRTLNVSTIILLYGVSYLMTKDVSQQEDMWKSGGIIHSFVANTKSLYPQETEICLLIPSI